MGGSRRLGSHRCSGASNCSGPLLLPAVFPMGFRPQGPGPRLQGRLGRFCFPLEPLFHGSFQLQCLRPGNVTAKASKAIRVVTMQDAVHRARQHRFTADNNMCGHHDGTFAGLPSHAEDMQSPAEEMQWKCSADANAINPPRDPPMATRLCRLAPCYQMPQSAVTGRWQVMLRAV